MEKKNKSEMAPHLLHLELGLVNQGCLPTLRLGVQTQDLVKMGHPLPAPKATRPCSSDSEQQLTDPWWKDATAVGAPEPELAMDTQSLARTNMSF